MTTTTNAWDLLSCCLGWRRYATMSVCEQSLAVDTAALLEVFFNILTSTNIIMFDLSSSTQLLSSFKRTYYNSL